jgi:hypothetical protein
VEGAQIVVHAQREAHPLDPVARRLGRARPGAEHHRPGSRLGDPHHDGLPAAGRPATGVTVAPTIGVMVEQPFQHVPATAQHAVHAPYER